MKRGYLLPAPQGECRPDGSGQEHPVPRMPKRGRHHLNDEVEVFRLFNERNKTTCSLLPYGLNSVAATQANVRSAH